MFLQFNAVRFPLPKLNPLIDELLVVEALSEEIPEMPLALEFEDDALLTVLVKREPLGGWKDAPLTLDRDRFSAKVSESDGA